MWNRTRVINSSHLKGPSHPKWCSHKKGWRSLLLLSNPNRKFLKIFWKALPKSLHLFRPAPNLSFRELNIASTFLVTLTCDNMRHICLYLRGSNTDSFQNKLEGPQAASAESIWRKIFVALGSPTWCYGATSLTINRFELFPLWVMLLWAPRCGQGEQSVLLCSQLPCGIASPA